MLGVPVHTVHHLPVNVLDIKTVQLSSRSWSRRGGVMTSMRPTQIHWQVAESSATDQISQTSSISTETCTVIHYDCSVQFGCVQKQNTLLNSLHLYYTITNGCIPLCIFFMLLKSPKILVGMSIKTKKNDSASVSFTRRMCVNL